MIATKKRQVIGQRLNKPCQYDAVTAWASLPSQYDAVTAWASLPS
jgi:hypothetical protein